MNRKTVFGLIPLAVLIACSCTAPAQRDISAAKVSFGFYRCDIRTAIQEYFNTTDGIGCSFGPGIRGKVSIEMFDIGWERGLQRLLEVKGLTYRSEGGIFQIVKRQSVGGFALPKIEKKPLFDSDSNIRILTKTNLTVESVDAEKADVKRLLFTLFRKAKASFVIGPDVSGTISVHLANCPFRIVLDRVLSQIGAEFRIQSGIYVVKSKEGYRDQIPPIDVDGRAVGFLALRSRFL